jgi:YfiH family protein
VVFERLFVNLFYRSPLLTAVPGIIHGFFGTEGGVSEGPFSSLNCDAKQEDSAENVLENRRRVMSYLGFPKIPMVALNQVHGTCVKTIVAPWPFESPPDGDGMVTDIPHLALAVLTADCGPVLFADTQKRVIGVCHAGWRGAFSGILEKTVTAMEALGSQRADISASLGPTIAQESYEVDGVFRQRFLDKDPATVVFFEPTDKAGHSFFDLPGFIKKKLGALRLKNVHVLGKNTFSGPFFSRRKVLKNQETSYGCSASVIVLS